MATCNKTGLEQSSNERPKARSWSCSSLRCWLIFWASLRLALSVIRTGTLTLMTYQTFVYYLYQRDPRYIPEIRWLLIYEAFALALQLLEFGMIVTFIVAGVKRSARLYRIYLRYCVLTLILYITMVLITLFLPDDVVHFGQIYLSYQLSQFSVAGNDATVLGVGIILTIGLESLLIYLIKRLLNKYSYVEANLTCENV